MVAFPKARLGAVPVVLVALAALCGPTAMAASTGDVRTGGGSSGATMAANGSAATPDVTPSSEDLSLNGPEQSQGDLEVVVPPAPRGDTIPGLCRAFLQSADRGGAEFRILVGATGGTDGATTAWCQHYLSLTGNSSK